MAAISKIKKIFVYADWIGISSQMTTPIYIGVLKTEQVRRSKEIFSFEATRERLVEYQTFVFTRSDLIAILRFAIPKRRQEQFWNFYGLCPRPLGKSINGKKRNIGCARRRAESKSTDGIRFLLKGVSDISRMGGLRFKLDKAGNFLDDKNEKAIPPFSSIRTLEEASIKMEKSESLEDPAFAKWLNILFVPGSSLGGARPKANVIGPDGYLWIAKFPSKGDRWDVGGWEMVVNELAIKSGLNISKAQAEKYYHKSYHPHFP